LFDIIRRHMATFSTTNPTNRKGESAMKSKFFAALIVAATLLVSPAFARTPAPIVNYDNIAVVTNNEKPLNADQVKKAIVAGASAKGWTTEPQNDGSLLATLVVRNKHTVIVSIAYTSDAYSVTYKGSDNMNFGQRDGQDVIHPFYNRWVTALLEAIRIELLKA
jgi:hypothetical protein